MADDRNTGRAVVRHIAKAKISPAKAPETPPDVAQRIVPPPPTEALPAPATPPPVFVDDSGRRRRWLRRAVLVFVIAATTALLLVWLSQIGGPVAPAPVVTCDATPAAQKCPHR